MMTSSSATSSAESLLVAAGEGPGGEPALRRPGCGTWPSSRRGPGRRRHSTAGSKLTRPRSRTLDRSTKFPAWTTAAAGAPAPPAATDAAVSRTGPPDGSDEPAADEDPDREGARPHRRPGRTSGEARRDIRRNGGRGRASGPRRSTPRASGGRAGPNSRPRTPRRDRSARARPSARGSSASTASSAAHSGQEATCRSSSSRSPGSSSP